MGVGVRVGVGGGVGVARLIPAGVGTMVAGVGNAGVEAGVELTAASGVGTAMPILFQVVVVGGVYSAVLLGVGAGAPESASICPDWSAGMGRGVGTITRRFFGVIAGAGSGRLQGVGGGGGAAPGGPR